MAMANEQMNEWIPVGDILRRMLTRVGYDYYKGK